MSDYGIGAYGYKNGYNAPNDGDTIKLVIVNQEEVLGTVEYIPVNRGEKISYDASNVKWNENFSGNSLVFTFKEDYSYGCYESYWVGPDENNYETEDLTSLFNISNFGNCKNGDQITITKNPTTYSIEAGNGSYDSECDIALATIKLNYQMKNDKSNKSDNTDNKGDSSKTGGNDNNPEGGTPEGGTPEGGTPEGGTPEGETPEDDTKHNQADDLNNNINNNINSNTNNNNANNNTNNNSDNKLADNSDSNLVNNDSSESKSADSVSKTETITVKDNDDGTLPINANVTNGKAKIADIANEEILKSVKESKNNCLSIDFSSSKEPVNVIEMSAANFSKLTTALNDTTAKELEYKTSVADIKFDMTSMLAIAGSVKGQSISLSVSNTDYKNEYNAKQLESIKGKAIATAFSASFESNGESIGDFKGGSATINLNYKPLEGTLPQFYHVYHIAEDGTMTHQDTWADADGIRFKCYHFSDYCVIYDTSISNELLRESDKEEVSLYTVQKGDSFWKIAKKLGMDFNSLLALNQSLIKNKYIYPGQTINIK